MNICHQKPNHHGLAPAIKTIGVARAFNKIFNKISCHHFKSLKRTILINIRGMTESCSIKPQHPILKKEPMTNI